MMDKSNNKTKKPSPRYFKNGDGVDSGVSGGGSGGGGLVKKKKKFQKFKRRDGSEDEAIDTAEEIGGGGDVVDPQEISTFMNKLGFNKFNSAALLSKASNKIPKQKKKSIDTDKKESKGKEVQERASPKIKDPKFQTSAKPKHLRFEESNDKVSNGVSDEDKGRVNKTKSKKKEGRPTPNKPTPVTKMLAKPTGSKWYEGDEEKESAPSRNDPPPQFLNHDEIAQIQKTAFGLLEADVQAYKVANTSGANKSDYQWMDKMMKTGTLPDRLAAYTVRIQDSPVHNLHYLQQLISMVKVQGKQQCMMTADTLRELFIEDLLPPIRKLVPFSNRGVVLKTATKRQLITWAFEDKLKILYISFVDAVKRMAADTVEKLRGKGIVTIYQLLIAHPEQEESLLQILVNKLGDPAKKLASRGLFYLKQLLDEHPRMKRVVVEEVERLLFRNNISKRAQYYGVCFLNLVDLRDEHPSLAHKLITVYIAFFKSCVKTGDIDTKMMSGLLTGINRAFPQAREFGFQFSENLDTLYKIVQFSQFNISVQALCILFQIVDVAANPPGADRFYRVLYEKLNTPEFKTSSHNAQLLNLVFKALKADTVVNRVTGFTKRLLQICQNCAANLACAILFLLSEVAKTHPQCIRIGNYSEGELTAKQKSSDEEIDSSESDDEQKNSNIEKAAALEKFMKSSNVQINPENNHQPKKGGQKLEILKTPEPIKESPDVIVIENGKEGNLVDEKSLVDVKPDIRRVLTQYDPSARNPCYSGAEHSLSYELMTLSHHFHPSVALFAQTLINRASIKYDGNPFRDFTLTRFLERFSYRNAKPSKTNTRPEYHPKGLRNLPVNSDNYLCTEEEKIPIEEKFFYRFFKTKKETKVKQGEKDEEDVSDAESVDDDEFDSLMSNYFKQTKGDSSDDESDEDEEEITEDTGKVDFASGLSAKKATGKKRKRDDSESEDDEDDDDGEEDFEGGDDFISMNNDGDFSEEDLDDEDELGMFEDDQAPSFLNKKRKMKAMKGDDMFAPAEEFAEMLEENADEVMTGSQTLINRERADKKQLKWEMDRDSWGKRSKKSFGKGHNKKKLKRS